MERVTDVRKVKSFAGAFAVTICLLGLGAGLFVAGYNSRRMARGDAAPQAGYRIEAGQLVLTDGKGNSVMLPMVPESDARVAAIPAPVRGSLQFLRALTAAAEKVVEKWL